VTLTAIGKAAKGIPPPDMTLTIYVDGSPVKTQSYPAVTLGKEYSLSATEERAGDHSAYAAMLLSNPVGSKQYTSVPVLFTVKPRFNILVHSLAVERASCKVIVHSFTYPAIPGYPDIANYVDVDFEIVDLGTANYVRIDQMHISGGQVAGTFGLGRYQQRFTAPPWTAITSIGFAFMIDQYSGVWTATAPVGGVYPAVYEKLMADGFRLTYDIETGSLGSYSNVKLLFRYAGTTTGGLVTTIPAGSRATAVFKTAIGYPDMIYFLANQVPISQWQIPVSQLPIREQYLPTVLV